MNINTIRSIIRKTIRKQLAEAAVAAAGPPKTFKDFRILMGSLLRDAGAPEELVDEIEDVGLEGGGVVTALWPAWSDFSTDIKEDGDDWKETLSFYASDIVLDIVDAFSNQMNYEPGRTKPRIDGKALADDVVGALTSSSSGSGDTPDRRLKDMAGLVTDILEQSGCAENVKWDGENTVTYTVTSDEDEFYNSVDREATGPAGLTFAPMGENEYYDKLGGLRVSFGIDSATIS